MHERISQNVRHLVGLILSPVLFSSSVLAQTQEAFPTVDSLSKSAAPSTALKPGPKSYQAGLKFEDAQLLNDGKLVSFTGTKANGRERLPGICSGPGQLSPTDSSATLSYTTPGQTRARFLSSTVPPASGLRVVIHNTTSGIDRNLSPYTDREYAQGNFSEYFSVGEDTAHNSRYLAVIPGPNTFTYQIKRSNEIIESGTFTAMLTVESKLNDQPANSGFDPPVGRCEHRK
jgi:hypothetical protein